MASIRSVKGEKQVDIYEGFDVVIHIDHIHPNAIQRLKEFMDADVDIERYSIDNEPTFYNK